MIIGKLKDLEKYIGLSSDIDFAIKYVLNTDLINLKEGKHILNDNVFVSRQSYFGKENASAESHKKYIDLQIVVKGVEKIGYADILNDTVVVKTPYDCENDIAFYDVIDETIYEMTDSSFAVIFPEDIHRPGVKVNEEMIEKVVVKIKIC